MCGGKETALDWAAESDTPWSRSATDNSVPWGKALTLLGLNLGISKIKDFVINGGADKLLPMDHIWPIAHFCIAYKLRIAFTFLNGWKKSKGESYFVTEEKYVKFTWQCPYMKSYWHSRTHFLPAVCGWFCATLAELSNCNTNHRWSTKYLLSGPLLKKFADLWLLELCR